LDLWGHDSCHQKYLSKHSFIDLFNNNYRYLEDILTGNNPNVLTFVKQINPKELPLNKANITRDFCQYLYLDISLFQCKFNTQGYVLFVFSKWRWEVIVRFVDIGDQHCVRRVWRYQRGNQNPYTSIEEEQTTQWPKEKVQKDKQWSTKHTHKTNDRVTRTPLKQMGELRCSGRVSTSWSTSGNRRVTLVTNPVISGEWGKCLRQVEHIRGHFWHRYSRTVNFLFTTV